MVDNASVGRMARSWELAKTSWGVLRHDKELALLPVLSALASIVVAIVLVVIGALTGAVSTDSTGTSDSTQFEPVGYLLGFIFVFSVTLIQIYFAGALIAGALARLSGENPTLSRCFHEATGRLGRLLQWTFVVTVFQIVMDQIRQRFGFLGDVFAWAGDIAFHVLTFLALPVILRENVGPINALKRSGELFKKTWGENVTAQIGFGLVGVLAALPGILVIVGGIVLASATLPLGVVVIVAGVAALLLSMAVMSALNGIFRAALYLYATTGQEPQVFAGSSLGTAFAPKHRRSSL